MPMESDSCLPHGPARPPARYGLHIEPESCKANGPFPAQSSVLDEEMLLGSVLPDHDIRQPEACRFYSRGDADVYRVESRGSVFYLKVYRPEYRPAHVESEGQLVADLAGLGVPVVRPVPLRAGGYARTVDAPEGPRTMLLFEQAPVGAVSEPDPAFCRSLGAAVAALHSAMDRLTGRYDLPAIDESSFDELLPYAEPLLDAADYGFLRTVADRVRPHLARLDRKPPDYGLCHLDLVLSNIRIDPNGRIVFFDFGTAGRGWRAYELAVLEIALRRPGEDTPGACWDALQAGYASERPLPGGLADRLPLMLLARTIGLVGGNAATLPLRLGTQPFEQGIMARAVARVRQIAAELSLPNGG
jgi:Ser/Thr protein kinase RdoA (MazF antagonist)